ncbi:FxSxx-COOH cyclophane-containing RiPP peptide [Streptomyces sp. NPDC026672]|uniref:FxSxx-COOH cyclophane-containing RiPP peptide n=1 Tax=unclassified Streptomyces TaxID=2593676 RepID=UPI0034081F52
MTERTDTPAEADEALPDLLGVDLEELRTVQHPVLREVLADLRERATRPSEMLWGWNNAI